MNNVQFTTGEIISKLMEALKTLLASHDTLQGYTDTDNSINPLVSQAAYKARTEAKKIIAEIKGLSG